MLQYGKGFTLVDPDIARTVLCIFWMLAEPVRLAAGLYGNLQENVSGAQQRFIQRLAGMLCSHAMQRQLAATRWTARKTIALLQQHQRHHARTRLPSCSLEALMLSI
jgi:hypothetical protein